MENYSCVRDCPEILSSLQDYIEEYFFENVELYKKWTDLKPIRLTYEVDIPLQTITDSFGKRIDEKDIIDTIIEKKAIRGTCALQLTIPILLHIKNW